jgi:hypothetical protein
MLEGHREDAEATWQHFESMSRERYVSPTDYARLALVLGRVDAAFTWLERARAERRGWLCYLKADPLLDSIRRDPRFVDLLRVMRLDR